ncbi:SHOCT domain-containing protein [Thermococcus litoralis]|nr:SHOCT domain-containing protein [Thermococcus litoralis]
MERGIRIPKSQEDPLEKLKKLKELYDMGVLSQEEYEEKRKKLLDQI